MRAAIANGADVIFFHEEMLLGYCEGVETLSEAGSNAHIACGLTKMCGNTYYISAPIATKTMLRRSTENAP